LEDDEAKDMQDGELDAVRAIIGEEAFVGVAGRLCAGGAQGGAMSRFRDVRRMTACGEVGSVEDIAVEKVDVDNF
jgi:hypothetical protein